MGIYTKRDRLHIPPKISSRSNPSPKLLNPSHIAISCSLCQASNIWMEAIIKLYIDDTGRYPILSLRCNHYIMIDFHYEPRTILQAILKINNTKHWIEEDRGQFIHVLEVEKGYKVKHQNIGW